MAWGVYFTRRSYAVGFGVAIVPTTLTAILRTAWRSCGNLRRGGKSLLRRRSFRLRRQASRAVKAAPDLRTRKCGFIRHALVRNILEKGIVRMERSATFCTRNRVCRVLCAKLERLLLLLLLVLLLLQLLPKANRWCQQQMVIARRQGEAASPRLQVQQLRMLALRIGKLGCVTNGKPQVIAPLGINAILLMGRMVSL